MQKVESGEDPGDEGIPEAFDVVAEISERYVYYRLLDHVMLT